CEFGQTAEWNHDAALQWELLEFPYHYKLQSMIGELNHLYRTEAPLHEVDDDYSGFDWIDFRDADASIIAFLRWSRDRSQFLVVVGNFTPVPRTNYRIGVPRQGLYYELLNTDGEKFGGSNMGNGGSAVAGPVSFHGHPASLSLTLPPLGVLVLKPTTVT